MKRSNIECTERNLQMVIRYINGETLRELDNFYGFASGRAQQITVKALRRVQSDHKVKAVPKKELRLNASYWIDMLKATVLCRGVTS
tara:strand:- start:4011 stop:4271 length:261 start_codon:yes stop_codon:yes gene_type:complete